MTASDPFGRYRALLVTRGLRVTPQRLLVVQTINEADHHLTAEEISTRIREHFPAIHQGTVYRTLESLREAGLISESHLGDRSAVYELIGTQTHHHLVCDHCGNITEIDDAPLERLRAELAAQNGFRARTEHIAIFGLCQHCATVLGHTSETALEADTL
ncbi:MAG: transcriptional repressor [Ktedonobacterales bacterium]|nr:transcriptional repressor [Ktedonobacterales bacterium]